VSSCCCVLLSKRGSTVNRQPAATQTRPGAQGSRSMSQPQASTIHTLSSSKPVRAKLPCRVSRSAGPAQGRNSCYSPCWCFAFKVEATSARANAMMLSKARRLPPERWPRTTTGALVARRQIELHVKPQPKHSPKHKTHTAKSRDVCIGDALRSDLVKPRQCVAKGERRWGSLSPAAARVRQQTSDRLESARDRPRQKPQDLKQLNQQDKQRTEHCQHTQGQQRQCGCAVGQRLGM